MEVLRVLSAADLGALAVVRALCLGCGRIARAKALMGRAHGGG